MKADLVRVLIAAALPVFLFPSAGDAYFLSGNKIYQLCEEDHTSVAFFAAGVFDAFNTFNEMNSSRLIMCPSESVTVGQAKDVLCNYLERNPAKRDWPASSLALYAFSEAWACLR